jgi:hypothetical protein
MLYGPPEYEEDHKQKKIPMLQIIWSFIMMSYFSFYAPFTYADITYDCYAYTYDSDHDGQTPYYYQNNPNEDGF